MAGPATRAENPKANAIGLLFLPVLSSIYGVPRESIAAFPNPINSIPIKTIEIPIQSFADASLHVSFKESSILHVFPKSR